jgi:hypothetical protein
MKNVIQHNVVLHARVIVPTNMNEVARTILNMQGWLVEKVGPNTQRLTPDYDNVEFVVSHHIGPDADEKGRLIHELLRALEAA